MGAVTTHKLSKYAMEYELSMLKMECAKLNSSDGHDKERYSHHIIIGGLADLIICQSCDRHLQEKGSHIHDSIPEAWFTDVDLVWILGVKFALC